MIRAAARSDVPRLLDLIDALNVQGTASDPDYRVRDGARAIVRQQILADWFGRFLPFPACWVAEEGGDVVAMIAGRTTQPHPVLDRPPVAHIDMMYVVEEHRRRGLGRELVERFAEVARDAGYAHLEVGTLARDARALAFWRSVGFADRRVILAR